MPKTGENATAGQINISELADLPPAEKRQRSNLEAYIKNGLYQKAIAVLAWLLSDPQTAPEPTAAATDLDIKIGYEDTLSAREKQLRRAVLDLILHRKYLEAKQFLETALSK